MPDFVISQEISFGLLPVGICFILIAAGLLLRRRWIAITGLLVLYAFSTPLVSNGLVGLLESRTPFVSIRDCPSADVIVALGGDDYRLERAVDLLQADRAPLLIVTIEGRPLLATGGTGLALREMAMDRGVPASKIVVTGVARNTAGEAAEVSRIARSMGFSRILLVTSALHMPRASKLFVREGLEVSGFASNYVECSNCRSLMPSARSLALSEMALHEMLGLLYDSVRH